MNFAVICVLERLNNQNIPMVTSTKLKVGITSTAIALGCVGATYLLLRHRNRLREAAEALNYLSITTVTSEAVCDDVVGELRRRSKPHRAVGFDCEWVTENGKRQPVALLQLSSLDGYCGLFRLNRLNTVPVSLKNFLEDPNIYKVGVAPADDAKYLLHDYCINLKSTLDIRHIALICGHNPGGLANLSKSLLNILLDKSWRVRCSDWGADELTDRQSVYAAADAHVAIKIFVKLVNEFGSAGLLSWFKSNGMQIWENLDNLCRKYADVSFKAKQGGGKVKNEVKQKPDREEVLGKRYPFPTRKKPLYHNCFLQAPDGELLCTCDSKKAMWYIEKNLADLVQEDPLTVRLRFEPSGRSTGDVGKYYQQSKENKCVVCGASQSYIRKNVVPREYRKNFPDIMKEHSSHDVVLLCIDCHQRSNIKDQVIREQLSVACDAPLASSGDNCKYLEDAAGKKIRSAARALLYQSKKHQLPEARRKELEDILLEHYPEHDEVTEDLLEEAARLQVVYENADYESHGVKVVEHYLQNGGLLQLEAEWRQHFLAAMRPRHLPPLWSVTHNEDRLRVKYNEGRLSEKDIKLIGLSRWL